MTLESWNTTPNHLQYADLINNGVRTRIELESLLSGTGGMMAGLRRASDAPYTCEEILIPLDRLTLHERLLPKEYLGHYDVTEGFLRWCMPLIGEKLPEIVQWAGKE